MKTLNIQDNKNFRNFLVIIFSLIPLSIIAGNSVMELNFIIIIFSFLIYLFNNKSIYYDLKKENFILLLLILWVYLVINTFLGTDIFNSIKRNILFFKFILIIISFKYFLINYEILKKILFFWRIIILIVCFDVFFEFFLGFNVLGFQSPMKNERIVSFFKDELIVGAFLFSFMFIVTFSLLEEKKFKSAFIFGLVIFIAILLSGERSIVIKLIFSSIIIILFIQNSIKIRLLSLVVSALIILVLLNNDIIKQRYVDQIKKGLNFEDQDLKHNLLHTKYLNQSVLSYEVLKNNVFFGVGNKNYFRECIKLKNTSKDSSVKVYGYLNCYTHPHQTYYEFLSEHGIFGTLLILIIFYKLLFYENKFKLPLNKKRTLLLLKIYCLVSFLPIVPTGSFFSNFQLMLFFLNYSFYQLYLHKNT